MIHTFVPRCRVTESKLKGERDGIHLHPSPPPPPPPPRIPRFQPGSVCSPYTEQVVRFWDIKSQSNVANFEGHEANVNCLAFSENGYFLATGAADATVKLWDLRKLKNFHTIASAATCEVASLHFDHSGAFLCVGGAAIGVYESKTWLSLNELKLPQTSGVCFGHAAKTLAAASVDGTVTLFTPAE